MPRSKTGNTREIPSKEIMESAVQDVLNNKLSLRAAQDKYKVAKSAIGRYVTAIKRNASNNFSYHPKFDIHRIFSPEEEQELVDYLKHAAQIHYGLTTYQTRKLAYDYAHAIEKNVPAWEKNKIAGISWLRMFRTRHPELSLRKPEATSLARSTAFNKTTVAEFFSNFKKILNRGNFQPHQIWNADESGCSTVHIPPKILATKGAKQIGTMTSGERGSNVTIIVAVNGVGNAVPPMFVFPRVHFKHHMLKGAPPGSVGATNPSGWSNEAIFFKFIEHFLSHAKPSLEEPHILIYDNHESHISLNVINRAKEAGLFLLTIPPHTSHKLQPLDRSVFGPFKGYYHKAMNEWMSTPGHAGKPVTIYDVCEIAGSAYELAFTPKNIVSGFKITGIIPLNENIFDESEFLPSYVTDRPLPTTKNGIDSMTTDNSLPSTSEESIHHDKTLKNNNSISNENKDSPLTNNDILSVEILDEVMRPSTPVPNIKVTPMMIRPFPKAEARNAGYKRRKGKSLILTDTPVKEEIERQKSTKLKPNKGSSQKQKPKPSAVRKIADSSSSDSELDVVTNDNDSDDIDFDNEMHEDEVESRFLISSIEVGDYILVKCKGERFAQHFVANVIDKPNGELQEFEVKYLKKMQKTDNFLQTEESEIFAVCEEDIVCKLPPPVPVGGTARSKNLLRFYVAFENYNMG